MADTVATATFQGADVDWYIKADDIVLKNKVTTLMVRKAKISKFECSHMMLHKV